MGMFDNFSEKASSFGKRVATNSKATAQKVKLETEIRNLKDEQNKLYIQLGREYYENFKLHTPMQAVETCGRIDSLDEMIADKENEIKKLNEEIK